MKTIDHQSRSISEPPVWVPQADIATIEDARFGRRANKNSDYRVKVARAGKLYVYHKKTFCRGGQGKIYVACSVRRDGPVVEIEDYYCIKEIRLSPAKIQSFPQQQERAREHCVDGLKTIESRQAFAVSLAGNEIRHGRKLDRFSGPIETFVNKKHSRLYLVSILMSGDGEDLVHWLVHEDGLPRLVAAIGIGRLVAADLAVIHQKNYLHQDVKLGNFGYLAGEVSVGELIDFGGSSRGRQSVALTRSQHYAAPEVVLGDNSKLVDGRSDSFSLAAVIGEVALGRPLLGPTGPDRRGPMVRPQNLNLHWENYASPRAQDAPEQLHFNGWWNDLKAMHTSLAAMLAHAMRQSPDERLLLGDMTGALKNLWVHLPAAAQERFERRLKTPHVSERIGAWQQNLREVVSVLACRNHI